MVQPVVNDVKGSCFVQKDSGASDRSCIVTPRMLSTRLSNTSITTAKSEKASSVVFGFSVSVLQSANED